MLEGNLLTTIGCNSERSEVLEQSSDLVWVVSAVEGEAISAEPKLPLPLAVGAVDREGDEGFDIGVKSMNDKCN